MLLKRYDRHLYKAYLKQMSKYSTLHTHLHLIQNIKCLISDRFKLFSLKK